MAINEKEIETVRRILREQISGVIDMTRADDYWKKILLTMEHQSIAIALSTELTHFNYSAARKCKCCRSCC